MPEGDALGRLEPGDVLVASFTGPSYNSLLPIVGALIVEEGGPLCHAAIVARELGTAVTMGDGYRWLIDPRLEADAADMVYLGVVSLAVVSDSHLSERAPSANANWDSVIGHLEATRPDFVVHGGDISLDGANDIADLRYARAQLDRIPVPWRAVPGNHDLGDHDDAPRELAEQRRTDYESVFGDRFWSTTLGEWHLVGLDSQHLMASDETAEQWWRWAASQLDGDAPTVVVQHRPLTPTAATENDTPKRYVTEPTRSRLQAMFARPNVRFVVSGHVHQWRSMTVDGSEHVWAPSTWATLADESQPVIGTKVVGLVELDLDGGPTAALRTPDGIDQAIIGLTIPSPYEH